MVRHKAGERLSSSKWYAKLVRNPTYAASTRGEQSRTAMTLHQYTHLSTGTSKKPWICDACRSMVFRSERTSQAERNRNTSEHDARVRHARNLCTHDEVVTTRLLYHVRHQLCRDRRTTLVLFILACVREQWDDRRDSLGTGNLARVDHDAQFHQRSVHGPAARVDDVHVVLAHRFCNPNVRLANAALRYLRARDRYTKPGGMVSPPQSEVRIKWLLLPFADDLCQLWMTCTLQR
jgi:hypothetical protein